MGLVLFGLLAESGGRVARRWTPNLLEQVAYGGALGLGILAYGVAGLAALGRLELIRAELDALPPAPRHHAHNRPPRRAT